MIFSDLIIISFLFFTGYVFLVFLNIHGHGIKKSLVSLPFGAGLWALTWIIISFIFDIFGVQNNRILTIISITGILLAVLYLAILNYNKMKDELFTITGSFIVLFVLILFFNQAGTSIIFGDSYSFITWTYQARDLVGRGTPLFGLSLANLSSAVKPDYYIFVYHPLININLLLLMLYMMLNSEKKTENKILHYSVVSLLILLFATGLNYIMHSFYVNHHAITAVYILLLSEYMIENGIKRVKNEIYFIISLTFFLTIVRMEGMILAVSAMVFIFFNDKIQAQIRKKAVTTYLLFSFVYVVFLSSALWNNPRFSSVRYISAWIIFALFYLSAEIFLRKYPMVLKYTKLIVMSMIILLFSVLFIFNNDHMNESFNNFVINILNTEFWGVTNITLLLFTLVTVVYRINKKIRIRTYDTYGYFFLYLVILIIVISNLRSPYNLGWRDSGNRMFYHCLPLIIIWIGYSIRDMIFSSKKKTG